ncbi:MAG: ABC transporter permease [Lentisphaerae bacterium]|nr:ABC transporter permease [Lentisphaerota bacterium]
MTEELEYSFAREVWKRYRSSFSAMFGLTVILLLCLVALCAPLLASHLPLLVRMNGVLKSPALAELFAPDSTEIFVSKTFNWLLLLLPALLLLRLIFRNRKKVFRIAAVIAALLLLIPFLAKGNYVDRTPWRALSAEMKNGDFAIFAPMPYGPYETAAVPYMPPSREHWLGTDHAGRDVFARMVFGARVSLAVGFLATGVSMLLGTFIGLIAGYKGGKTDLLVMRLVEIVICFPTFLLLLILMSILLDYGSRQSILLVIAVIGLTGWTGLCRLVRGETLRVRQNAYIQSCEAMGTPLWRILLFHLLPNVSGPIFVSFTFEVAGAILAESSLSFLGFGVQDPTASWGELLRQAFPDPLTYWHLMFAPGLAIFLAVCSFNLAGEGLRKALDAKS